MSDAVPLQLLGETPTNPPGTSIPVSVQTLGTITASYSFKYEFGGVVDGVTDDSARLQAAINTVAAAGGGTIYWLGSVLIGKTVSLASGVFLAGFNQNASWFAGSLNTTKLVAPAAGFIGTAMVELPAACTSAGVLGLMLDGKGSGVNGLVDHGKDNRANSVKVTGAKNGIVLEGSAEAACQEGRYRDVWAISNSEHGWLMQTKSYDHTLTNCGAHDNTLDGFHYGPDVNNVKTIQPFAEWNHRYGFYLDQEAGSANTLMGPFTQGNYQAGIVVRKFDGNVLQIIAPHGEADGWSTGTGSAILIEGTSAEIQAGPVLITGASSAINPEGGHVWAPAYGITAHNAYQVDVNGELAGVLAGVNVGAEANLSKIGQIVEATPTRSTKLTEALSAIAVIAKVTSTAAFAAAGVVQIGTEKIGYTEKTATELKGLTRGIEGTAAAEHAGEAVVTDPSSGSTRTRPNYTVGAWAAFEGGAKIEGVAGYATPGARSETMGGSVRIRGRIKIKAGEKVAAFAELFKLPAGLRPPVKVFLTASVKNKILELLVNEGGVAMPAIELLAGEEVQLDGLTFNLT